MKTMIDRTLYRWKRTHKSSRIFVYFSHKWNVSIARNNASLLLLAFRLSRKY